MDFTINDSSFSTTEQISDKIAREDMSEVVVDGEEDSEANGFTFYSGLHAKTGALRYGKPNGEYAQNE